MSLNFVKCLADFSHLSPAKRISHIKLLFTSCAYSELSAIKDEIELLLYCDFILNLSQHSVSIVLSYLNAREILTCELVSKSWYDTIQSHDHIWRYKLLVEDLYSQRIINNYNGSQWRNLYRHCRLTTHRLFNSRHYSTELYLPLDLINPNVDFNDDDRAKIQDVFYYDACIIVCWLSLIDFFISLYQIVSGTKTVEFVSNILSTNTNLVSEALIIARGYDTFNYTVFLKQNLLIISCRQLYCVDLNSLSIVKVIPKHSMSPIEHIEITPTLRDSTQFPYIAILHSNGEVYVVNSNGEALQSFSSDFQVGHIILNDDLSVTCISKIDHLSESAFHGTRFTRDGAVAELNFIIKSRFACLSSCVSIDQQYIAVIIADTMNLTDDFQIMLFNLANCKKIHKCLLSNSNSSIFPDEYNFIVVSSKFILLQNYEWFSAILIFQLLNDNWILRRVHMHTCKNNDLMSARVICINYSWLNGELLRNDKEINSTDVNEGELNMPIFLYFLCSTFYLQIEFVHKSLRNGLLIQYI